MSKRPKVFEVRAHSCLMIHKKCRTPWLDVWVSTSTGKRKRKEFTLLIRSMSDVRKEIELSKFVIAEDTYPDFVDDEQGFHIVHRPFASPEEEVEYKASSHEDLERETQLLARLEAVQVVMESENTLSVGEEYLTRDDLAQAIELAILMRTGHENIKLKWKRPDICIGQW